MSSFPLDDTEHPIISLHRVTVAFGDVTALRAVDLELRKGELHAVVGEHGAGKSSLGLTLSGFVAATEGEIRFNGRRLEGFTSRAARRLGIEIVTQHNPLFDQFTVANNLFVNNTVRYQPFYSQRRIIRLAKKYLSEMGFSLDPSALLKNLDLSDRVLVDFLKHVYAGPQVLILDEALEKLSTTNLDKVMAIINRMKKNGATIVFITHRIDDIRTYADRISIMKGGRIILTDSVENIDKINIIRLAYTQFVRQEASSDDDKLFYQLLKYNEAILTELPVNLAVVDSHRRVKLINRSARHFFETHFESTPHTMEELFASVPLHVSAKVIESIREKVESVIYQVHFNMRQGDVIANVRILPVFDADYYLGSIVTIEDITQQEKLREQIILSENLSSIGLLAAGVAHEINNPLEIINNFVQELRFQTRDTGISERLDGIEEEVSGISQIIGNLITFSDDQSAYTEDVDVVKLVEDLVALIRHNASYNRIEIDLEKSESPMIVRASRTEVKQAILNIIKNSFEAMENGGKLSVRSTLVDDKNRKEAQLVFQDTGPGISEENMQSIFLPFSSTKGESQENMGLGLFISYGIVKKYGGSISVENNPPWMKGCTFTIRFPL